MLPPMGLKGRAITPVVSKDRAPLKQKTKKHYSSALKPNRICFRLPWNMCSLSSFGFLPFGMGLSILCLSPPYTLETENLPGFIGSQVERILLQDESHLRVSPVADLDIYIRFQSWCWNGSIHVGLLGMGWVYFACRKDMNRKKQRETRGQNAMLKFCPPSTPNSYVEVPMK